MAVHLSGTQDSSAVNLANDVGIVQDAIKTETADGRNVFVVGHSFGGIVAASSIKGLARPADAPADTRGVVGLMLIATAYIREGLCTFDVFGGNSAPEPVGLDMETGWSDVVGEPKHWFYGDLSDEDAAHYASKLRRQAIGPMVDKEHTHAGWLDVPTWFLAATQDNIIYYESQKRWTQEAREAGAIITYKEMETSHSPFLSKPQETASFIEEAVLSLD